VEAFLNGRLRFPQFGTVAQVMDRHRTVAHPDLDAIWPPISGARGSDRRIGKK